MPDSDFLTWAHWFEHADRVVKQDHGDGVRVSTVFLGLDHNFGGDGPPLLFETMIFGGPEDGYQERSADWETALICHQDAMIAAGLA